MFNFPVISGRDFWRKMRALGRNEPQPRSDFLPPPINQPTRDCITLYQVLDH
jgi:hypothetical protein